jgi:putative addiction module antidote
MIKAKVTTVGNSLGIILPKEALHKLHVKKGDVLYLCETPDGYALSPYDEVFITQMELAEDIMRENKDVLKVLSKS